MDVRDFWEASVTATGLDGPCTAWGFGNDPDMADEETPVVIETFELIWPVGPADGRVRS